MIKWIGWLIALYAAAHTVGALTVEGAARYAPAWFSGQLWGEDLSAMSPANSALWLSLNSFGPPLLLLGLLVVWIDRQGLTPPTFIAWALIVLTVVDGVISISTPWPIMLALAVLLLVGIHRRRRDHAVAAGPAGGHG